MRPMKCEMWGRLLLGDQCSGSVVIWISDGYRVDSLLIPQKVKRADLLAQQPRSEVKVGHGGNIDCGRLVEEHNMNLLRESLLIVTYIANTFKIFSVF